MTDIHDEDIQEQGAAGAINQDAELIARLFEYASPKSIPWKKDYDKQMVECYQFVEGNQWESADMRLLALSGIPTIAVDRIDRNLTTIEGIRENTGNTKKIVPARGGDPRVAEILDEVYEYTSYNGNFQTVRKESFQQMLRGGMGIRVCGFDPSQGDGEIWAENVPAEDCGWSRCKNRDLSDARWIWRRQIMEWEEAMLINPDMAGILKGIRSTISTEWDKAKQANNKGVFARDYENLVVTHAESQYSYKDQVEIWEFWVKRLQPLSKIATIQTQVDPTGQLQSVPQVRHESVDYQPLPHEQNVGAAVKETWEQYIIASSGGKTNAVLLKQGVSEFPFHPFVGMCADRKKSGAPRGFVEIILPHQKRINVAWAQKTAWNNKAIKSPIIGEEGSLDIENAQTTSSLGTFLFYKQGYNPPIVNQVAPVNLQAIEEGNVARQDMDFAASASEPALRGQSTAGRSGIGISLDQSAAVTPLNKWVKADGESELAFARKILHMIIQKFPPERIARIIGVQRLLQLAQGKVNPVTGEPLQPPIPPGFTVENEHYDVEIQDSSVSDFNKQQSFNAVMAMKGEGILFTDDYVIQNAPVKDVESAIASNDEARNDMMRQMAAQMQMMQAQIQMLERQVPPQARTAQGGGGQPNRNPHQAGNAVRGRNAAQSRQSMLGGMGPASPVGVAQ